MWHLLCFVSLVVVCTPTYSQKKDSVFEVARVADFSSGSSSKVEQKIYFNKTDIIEDNGVPFVFPAFNNKRTTAMATSKNNRFFVSGSTGMGLWDFNNKILVYNLNYTKNYINAIAFSPDSKLLVSGDKDGVVDVINVEKGKLVNKAYAHKGGVSKIIFSSDGTNMISSGLDRRICVWSTTTWKIRKILILPKAIKNIALSPNNQSLAVCLSDGKLQIMDLEKGDILREFSGDEVDKEDKIVDVIYSPLGKYFITISLENNWMIWDAVTNKVKRKIYFKDVSITPLIKFCPNEKRYISTFFDPTFSEGYLRSWDMETNKLISNIHLKNNLKRFYTDALFSEDAKNLFSMYADVENQATDVVLYNIGMNRLLCD